MTFQEAIMDVLAIVKRQDKVAIIRHSINRAIADLVRHDKFSFDLKQLDYTIPSAESGAGVHFLPYTAFADGAPRSIESIITDNDITPYEEIKPRNALRNGRQRDGVYYKRSDGIFVRVRAAATTLRVSHYVKAPKLVNDADTHWSLEQAPAEVVARACQYVFAAIGEDRDAARYERSSAVDYIRLQQDLD